MSSWGHQQFEVEWFLHAVESNEIYHFRNPQNCIPDSFIVESFPLFETKTLVSWETSSRKLRRLSKGKYSSQMFDFRHFSSFVNYVYVIKLNLRDISLPSSKSPSTFCNVFITNTTPLTNGFYLTSVKLARLWFEMVCAGPRSDKQAGTSEM